jgi:hypothetical protein
MHRDRLSDLPLNSNLAAEDGCSLREAVTVMFVSSELQLH